MKTPLILASLFLSSHAHAITPRSLECKSLTPSIYSASVKLDGTAKVYRSHAKSDLVCNAPEQKRERHPDEPGVMTDCAEKVQGDTGYHLVVKAEGNGAITAELSEESFAGPRELAQLVCRWNF